MGTTPEDTCVVEDGLYAVRTANNAGYYTIGVYDASSHDDWQDLQKEADLALESLEDVQGINVLFLFLLSLLSCQDTNRSGKDVSEDMEEPVDTCLFYTSRCV